MGLNVLLAKSRFLSALAIRSAAVGMTEIESASTFPGLRNAQGV